MSLRWMVTGATGMLGSDVVEQLSRRGETVVAASKDELDITAADEVLNWIDRSQPDVIVNCAAYTKVDDCEENRELADRVNGHAVGNLTNAANRRGALLVQVSTDFVFDGAARTPYEIDAPVAPLSAYGASKLLGEQEAARAERHLIVRTSWLFGRRGPSFPAAIRRQIDSGRTALRVVDDQRGRPTWTPHLAGALITLANAAASNREIGGVFHYADLPEVSWYELALEIARILRPDGSVTVTPVSTEEFPRPARRPSYSVLSTERYEKVTGREPRQWLEGLRQFLA